MLMLDLFAALDADPVNAVLPEGTYTVSDKHDQGTWATGTTFVNIVEESGKLSSVPMISGEVIVAHEGSEYLIRADLVPIGADEALSVMYRGPITFVQTTSSTYEPSTRRRISTSNFRPAASGPTGSARSAATARSSSSGQVR